MIKALLIDDEPLARSILNEYLVDYPEINVMKECNDGFEAAKAIAEFEPDLIFLDVQMPKINGFELLELLEDPPAVIFTTAFEEFAIQAFEQHAIDYLLKPISKSRFDKAIQKFLTQNNASVLKESKEGTKTFIQEVNENNQSLDRVLVRTGNNIKIIPVSKINYLAADDDYVCIHTDEGSSLKKNTLSFFEKNLNEKEFVRVHRSFIVRINQIIRIEPYEKESHKVILKDKTSISVSKSGYTKLKKALEG